MLDHGDIVKHEAEGPFKYICNELGEVNAGWIPARAASVDQVHTKK